MQPGDSGAVAGRVQVARNFAMGPRLWVDTADQDASLCCSPVVVGVSPRYGTWAEASNLLGSACSLTSEQRSPRECEARRMLSSCGVAKIPIGRPWV